MLYISNMKKFALTCLLPLLALTLTAQKDYTSLVNPFIGTGGHGHTYPGASMPFGMMQLSPDTRMADWDGSSGYHYSDSVIYGFSHTHLSGTGIPDYCDVLMMPFSGDVKWKNNEYRSSFSHQNEKASPGYYEVLLDKHNIKAQLTTSYRSGMHQYQYAPSTNDGAILIDLKHRDQVLESYIEKVSPYELRGLRRSKSWAPNQHLYFYIRFEQPIEEFAVIGDDGRVSNSSLAQGTNVKAMVRFNTTGNKIIRSKVGISGVSTDGAKLNLDTEIPKWDFNQVHQSAKEMWNKELSKIDIKGGTKDQQTIFYTALYHTFLAPNIYQDVDGQYRGTDLKVHRANGFTNYSVFSLWDTYRGYHPLMTIINQKRTTDWINTFLGHYKNGGMLPVWELSGNETFCMIGYHSVPVITDAYQKGIRGFDTKLALEAMRSYAESDRFGLAHYRENGFLSNEKEHESVSKTLEYAYDDWCIAQFAKALGADSVYQTYIQRAQFYKNVFDPVTKHMRGKVAGLWFSPFDAREVNNFYTEGNSWQYSFAVPQDIQTLIQLYGGKQAFAAKLNELFTTSSKLTGREQADVTGLIGQYAHGNEPSHHMAYLFNYVGMPWRTQELLDQINTEFYKNSPDGLIGNEDCGQMSAWFVLSSMGFYPVTPGTVNYDLGTPLFDEVKINLEDGKSFIIKAKGRSPKSKYVASAILNKKPYSLNYIQHADIINGGEFEFVMSTTPQKVRGIKESAVPVSKIKESPIVSVPYFDIKTNKFAKETQVRLKAYEPNTDIYYMWVQPNIRSTFVKYTKPFTISETGELYIYAQRNGVKSKQVVQPFHRVPDDKKITVLSKVHPMYTAGGPETLIDGITGNANYRTGSWQSYFDTDFDAIVDLKKIKPVSYLGVHVLQDVSPWIVYPKEVIFYGSEDGKNYKEISRVKNTVDRRIETIQEQELGTEVSGKVRYIKVKVVSGGKLPEWHESAGQPSHLFIDEVIVR
jgi:predicted alpha-1,2-mannosidase